MRTSRCSEEQIVGILKEQEAGAGTGELRRRHGISAQTFYRWKQKYGGLDAGEARRTPDSHNPWTKQRGQITWTNRRCFSSLTE